MSVIIFPYSQSNKSVEKCCIETFGVEYEDSPVSGMELNIYAALTKLDYKHLLNEREFRLLQIALIYYVYYQRNTFSKKGFFVRTKFLQMSRLTRMVVIETVKQAERANAFSLMGSSNPTHL
ncbi:hypothetical protein Sbal183_3583 [Shewanella baltica OS183]|uniref:hypothetical protein n=1 Tax=Shewanella baltica TaxID=62322 RepID=UPI0001E10BD8|nr:hypothetical protein [Shewanella baltica]EHQ16463.1 hypothetical protein Sbal183_3583 [Shewanella baltica OS183]